MENSKVIVVSMIAAIIAVVGVATIGHSAKAAVMRPIFKNQVYVYADYGQRPPQTHRVKVTPFQDFWSVLKYSR